MTYGVLKLVSQWAKEESVKPEHNAQYRAALTALWTALGAVRVYL